MPVSVAFWNVGRNRRLASLALAQAEDADIDVLGIQEPLHEGDRIEPPCPARGKYNIVWTAGSRAALYVHKKHKTANWSAEAGKDWCRATFGTGARAITIWSIYSPNPGRFGEWESPLLYLPEHPPAGHHILGGDVNLHHPLWDPHGRTSPRAGILLDVAVRWGLTLLTPEGTITRTQRHDRDSCIDHIWASLDLSVEYLGDPGWSGSDHRAQAARCLQRADAPSTPPPLGWNWMLTDHIALEAEAQYITVQSPAESLEELNLQAIQLIHELTRVADRSTPRSKGSCGSSQAWWNKEVKEAARDCTRAARAWRASRTDFNWEAMRKAKAAQGRAVRHAQTSAWRKLIAKASENPDGSTLWRLERWARLRSHAPRETARLPPLGRDEQGPATAAGFAGKEELLAERFFPAPPADLGDVAGTPWREPLRDGPARSIPIDQGVDWQDIELEVKSMKPWKAPGPDLLPVGFLKACGKPFYQALAVITEASFRFGFPDIFKESTTVVLPKPNKTQAEKRTPGAYRPIALLNTVGKVMEKVMQYRITKAAEEAGLLPDG
jgi:Endonuclease-reverse transcriptase